MNISKMIINKTYSKRKYITPACNVSDMELILQSGFASVNGSDVLSGDGKGDNNRPLPRPVKGFYFSGDKCYQGYGNEW